jgi:hypothetical protein
MIVEKPAFEIVTFSQPVTTRAMPRGSRGRGRGATLRGMAKDRAAVLKNGPEYAIAHGQRRGMFDGQHDVITKLDETHITPDVLRNAKGEGVYVYIQTTHCRRQVLRTVFQNGPPSKWPVLCHIQFYTNSLLDVEPSLCCDLCNSKLFDQVRPSEPQQATRQKAHKHVAPVDSIRTALYGWRRNMKAKYWPRSLWGPQAILNDDLCELLSSIGPVDTLEFLSSVLKESWEWWDKLGDELLTLLSSLAIPPLPTRHSRGVKRRPVLETEDSALPSTLESSPTKRSRRTQATPPVPSSVSLQATTSSTLTVPRRQRVKEIAPLEFPPTLYDDFFSGRRPGNAPPS